MFFLIIRPPKRAAVIKHKETATEFQRKLQASPEYWKTLDEDAQIVLTQDKAGPWKTLEESSGKSGDRDASAT